MDDITNLFLLDEQKQSPNIREILLYTIFIFLLSNVVYIICLKIFNINPKLDEKNIFEQWRNKGISVSNVLFSGILNTSIYNVLAEELTIRMLLMKLILIKTLKIDTLTAVLIQAVIFGSLHLSNNLSERQSCNYTKLQVINSSITALISGFVFVYSNSLIPSILSHFLTNFCATINETIEYRNYLLSN